MSLQKVIGSQALSALASDIKASIALKADQSDTYTKEEVDDKIAGSLPEKSASGAIASFETNYADKLKSLSTTIVASGGYDADTQTEHPIVGYSEVNFTNEDDNHTELDRIIIQLGQTVYDGRLYFENGWKCDVTHGYVDLGTCTWGGGSDVGGKNLFTVAIADIKRPATTTLPNWKLEGYELKSQAEAVNYNNVYSGLGWFDGVAFWTTDYTATQREQLRSDMSGVHLCYELATPFTLDLSSSDMLDAVVGSNNVFSDCGNTELEYYYKVTELASLDDVNVSNPVNGQVLKYDSASDKWINATGGGSTPWTDVTGTLTAGQTSITLSNPAITTSSTLDYYTDTFGVNPTSVSVANGSVTLTFEAQASNLGVKVRVS